ncbi:PhzF family phenazine biosynthesis protein [Streptomyces sp. NPDC051993]|uniref:PhzF family phenazine biosynthesis protein n=1 Tax=Streptomyces sp. NPDC051993 TaxID=3155286 RepID=UPI0034197188
MGRLARPFRVLSGHVVQGPLGGDGVKEPQVRRPGCGPFRSPAVPKSGRSGERGLLGTFRFRSRESGTLVTHADREGAITLDFPTAPSAEVPVPQGLLEALAVKPEATFRADALGDLLTVLSDEAAVRTLTPDLDALAALTRREGLRAVIVTAPAAACDAGYDFVSRFFAPARGIPEDPVTGSAHTVLAPYWSARLGRTRLTGLQASARTGLVRTALHGDRVHLTGNAVTVPDGTLHA